MSVTSVWNIFLSNKYSARCTWNACRNACRILYKIPIIFT